MDQVRIDVILLYPLFGQRLNFFQTFLDACLTEILFSDPLNDFNAQH